METKQEYQQKFEDNPYNKTVRIKSAKLKLLKENKKKKSVAAFLCVWDGHTTQEKYQRLANLPLAQKNYDAEAHAAMYPGF